MSLPMSLCRLILATVIAMAVASGVARSEEPDFSGQTITIVVGYGPGGGYDTVARLAADHLGKFLPGNPAVIVENMPGGGGMRSIAYLTSVAPRDGTVISIVPATIAFDSVHGGLPDVSASDFRYLGRLTAPPSVAVTWHSSPTKTLEDARGRETIMGSTGASATSSIAPRIANALVGTKFKVVEGFTGTEEVSLAMERGEVEGMVTNMEALAGGHPDWLTDGKISILWQLMLTRSPEYPDIPTLMEFADTVEQRSVIATLSVAGEIGRTLAVPPGASDETVSVLRSAVSQMVLDPAFIADAGQRALRLNYADGAAIQSVIADAVDVTPEVRAVIDKALNYEE